MLVVTLDQASAGGVIVSGGECQSGIFGERINGLNQPFAEGNLARDQAAVMILNSSGDNLSRRCRESVHQDNQRIILPAIAMLRHVTLLGGGASVMRNNYLTLFQELVGNANAFTQQAAGVATQVKNQTFQIAHFIERLRDFFFRSLVEAGHVQVADAGTNQKMHVYAVARNLIAYQRELHRFLYAFARDADVYGRALRSLQQISNVTGAHVLGGLAIDRDDYVAGMNARFIGGSASEGKNNDDFVVARADGHAHAVILAALVLAH